VVSQEEGAHMTRRALSVLVILSALLPFPRSAFSQQTRLLIVVGLGGDAQYREVFHGWAMDLVTAAKEELGIAPDHITYLAERTDVAPEIVQARSTVDNIGSVLAAMARDADPQDRVLIVLIGHGTGDGEDVEFNLPGPDLTPKALDVMLDGFSSQTVAVVNTSPSSGPFVEGLSGPNRVILTATRTAQERNETQFGAFFVKALQEGASDLDKDGRISLLEVFDYSREEVERYYQEQNLLATEHAQLDDDGDGEGTTELTEEASDGWLARTFWLGSVRGAASAVPELDSISDPELRSLYAEKADLERRIQELRGVRAQMEQTLYEEELEALLVDLALTNRKIREKGGGGS
jgi:hypothetical protein